MRYTWMLPCAVLGGVLMAACQVLIYRYAPVEQTMGLVQKIFYTHLPLAWWSFVSFFLVCVAGVAYLKTRNRHWDAVAGAAAALGGPLLQSHQHPEPGAVNIVHCRKIQALTDHPFFDIAGNVFNHHNGIIDHKTSCNGKRHQGQIIDTEAKHKHNGKRTSDG